ncbi:unnamed protein product [Mytilus edulis]|uniref:Uncharacterized protein n=1 Tax=Mytilus edulis TaxID=6550 RepID=A0A8S3T2U9_MYTED|nr:unnamed protein product [Mytilus edulis]
MSHPRSSTQKGKDSCSYPSSCSLFSKDKVAETIRSVRKEAVSSPTYVGSVLPYGYGCVRKQEKVVFPDGTVYSLTASWVADPTLAMLQEAGLQTSPEKAKVSDKEVNTPQFYNAWSIGEKTHTIPNGSKQLLKLINKAEPLRKEKTYETKIREEVETVLVINSDDDDVKMKQEPEEVKLKAESCICVSDSESHVSFTDQRLKLLNKSQHVNGSEDITSVELHSILTEIRNLEQSPIEKNEANDDSDFEIGNDVENYFD